LNIVLDEAVEEKDGGEKVRLGMVVCIVPSAILATSTDSFAQVIRGNSVVMLEALERIGGDDRR
jgi:small nuclear ribonucleoprotein G